MYEVTNMHTSMYKMYT